MHRINVLDGSEVFDCRENLRFVECLVDDLYMAENIELDDRDCEILQILYESDEPVSDAWEKPLRKIAAKYGVIVPPNYDY